LNVGRFIALAIVVALAVAVAGVVSRRHDDDKLAHWTNEQAIATVALTTLKRETEEKEIVLPGDVEAYYSASIHGQASGYVREWSADIGAKVRKGDVLAVVETPELDQRLAQAEGELAKAKANQELAQMTANRWKSLGASAAVSEQAIDEKEGDAHAKDAELAAAQANLDRLRALKSFANIVSPFDGVVTARNVDIGALVSATSSASLPLFTVADIHLVRVYVRAPESYGAALKNGMKAKVFVPEYPERPFEATISTTSHAIDAKSRSLLVELISDNTEGLLTPGSFAQVRFQLPPDPNAARLPASALLFRDQSTMVATVGPDNRVHLNKIRIERDYGSQVEIAGALPANARIVASPSESIAEGDQVRLADPSQVAAGTPNSPPAAALAQSPREQPE
jgi:RND family efflux transporter MFP subunit